MARAVCVAVVLVAVVCGSAAMTVDPELVSGRDVAQEAKTCSAAEQMENLNVTKLLGTWFEVAREPAGTGVSCVELNAKVLSDKQTVDFKLAYSSKPSSTLMDTELTANSSITNMTGPAGFNLTYSGIPVVPITMKILFTDYSKYALVCGYADASNTSTSFGVVLTRERIVNTTWLQEVQVEASKKFTNFPNGTMSVVVQSPKCHRNSAATSVLSGFLVVLYILLRFVN